MASTAALALLRDTDDQSFRFRLEAKLDLHQSEPTVSKAPDMKPL